jgi:hypothetical protein
MIAFKSIQGKARFFSFYAVEPCRRAALPARGRRDWIEFVGKFVFHFATGCSIANATIARHQNVLARGILNVSDWNGEYRSILLTLHQEFSRPGEFTDTSF